MAANSACINQQVITKVEKRTVIEWTAVIFGKEEKAWLYNFNDQYVLLILQDIFSQDDYYQSRRAYLVSKETYEIDLMRLLQIKHATKKTQENSARDLKKESVLAQRVYNNVFVQVPVGRSSTFPQHFRQQFSSIKNFPNCFIVMPFFKGRPINEEWSTIQKLSFTKRMASACKIAQQYVFCHVQEKFSSVVHAHNDGSNMLFYACLDEDNIPQVNCRLINFELAERLVEENKKKCLSRGSILTMAPEVYRCAAEKDKEITLSLAADVYTLTALLAYALGEATPFKNKDKQGLSEEDIVAAAYCLDNTKVWLQLRDPLASERIYQTIILLLAQMQHQEHQHRPTSMEVFNQLYQIYQLCESIEQYWTSAVKAEVNTRALLTQITVFNNVTLEKEIDSMSNEEIENRINMLLNNKNRQRFLDNNHHLLKKDESFDPKNYDLDFLISSAACSGKSNKSPALA